jgi:hypothetical protein
LRLAGIRPRVVGKILCPPVASTAVAMAVVATLGERIGYGGWAGLAIQASLGVAVYAAGLWLGDAILGSGHRDNLKYVLTQLGADDEDREPATGSGVRAGNGSGGRADEVR